MILALLDILLRWCEGLWIGGPIRSLAGLLNQIEFRVLFAAGIAFAVVMVMGKPTISWLVRKRIGDTGQTDAELLRSIAQSKANTPSMGGILICGAVLVLTLLLCNLTNTYIHLVLVVTVWLAILGGIDDWLKLTRARRGVSGRQGLFAWEKLVFQLGLGLLVGVFAFMAGNNPETAPNVQHALNIPFQRTYTHVRETGLTINPTVIFLGPVVYITFATLMLGLLSNAVNITDGQDGLSAGIGMFVAIGLIVLSLIAGTEQTATRLLVPYVPGADELAVVSGALLGALIGFLWFNCSPATVFMGDCGALTIGGIIACVAIVTRQEIVVMVMCLVYLWEILSVILQVGSYRLRNGKRIFLIAPYHHHLHHKGWPEQRIVARFWLITLLMVVLGLATLKLR